MRRAVGQSPTWARIDQRDGDRVRLPGQRGRQHHPAGPAANDGDVRCERSPGAKTCHRHAHQLIPTELIDIAYYRRCPAG